MGGEGEGSGVKGGGKWGERGREVGVGYPPVHPLNKASIRTKMVDIDSKEKNAFSATTVERIRFGTKEGMLIMFEYFSLFLHSLL